MPCHPLLFFTGPADPAGLRDRTPNWPNGIIPSRLTSRGYVRVSSDRAPSWSSQKTLDERFVGSIALAPIIQVIARAGWLTCAGIGKAVDICVRLLVAGLTDAVRMYVLRTVYRVIRTCTLSSDRVSGRICLSRMASILRTEYSVVYCTE